MKCGKALRLQRKIDFSQLNSKKLESVFEDESLTYVIHTPLVLQLPTLIFSYGQQNNDDDSDTNLAFFTETAKNPSAYE